MVESHATLLENRTKRRQIFFPSSQLFQVARKLRIHLTTTLLDQPWQLPVADIVPPPKIDPSTNEADLAVDPSLAPRSPSSFTLPTAAPVGAVDFSKGTGVPRWELAIAGEIVLLVRDSCQSLDVIQKITDLAHHLLLFLFLQPEEAHVAKNFTAYVLRIVVETDRDATLYDGPSVIDVSRTDVFFPTYSRWLDTTDRTCSFLFYFCSGIVPCFQRQVS